MTDHKMAPRPYGFVKVPKALFTTDGVDVYDIIVYAVLRDFAAMIQQETVFPSIETISEMTGGKVSPSKAKKSLIALREAKALDVISRNGTSSVYAPTEYADRPVSGHRDTAGLGPRHDVSTKKTDLTTTTTTTPLNRLEGGLGGTNKDLQHPTWMNKSESEAQRLIDAWRGAYEAGNAEFPGQKPVLPPSVDFYEAQSIAKTVEYNLAYFPTHELLVEEIRRLLNVLGNAEKKYALTFKGVCKHIGESIMGSDPVIFQKQEKPSGTP